MTLTPNLQQFVSVASDIQVLGATNDQLTDALAASQQNAGTIQQQLAAKTAALAQEIANENADESQIAQLTADKKTLADQLAAELEQLNEIQSELLSLESILVFDSLEFNTWLLAPGAAANSNQTGSLTTATQSIPGVNSAFLATAPKGPYADGYFYQKFGALPKANTFTYEQSFLFGTAADAAAPQCVELDIQQVIAGRTINPGFQWNFVMNKMNIWNRSLATPANTGGGNWVSTGMPCPRWTPNQWMKMKFEAHRDDGSLVFIDAITINGTRSPLGAQFTTPILPSFADEMVCAIQLDSNSAGAAFKLYINRVRFTAQAA